MFLNRDCALHDGSLESIPESNNPMPQQEFSQAGTEVVDILSMKHSTTTAATIPTYLLATIGLVCLAGCGGGGGGGSEQPSAPATGANSAPTIQGSPATSIAAGQAYSFQPTASDPDGDPLTFSVANLPAWATFNASTGKISGTPAAADVATYSNIRVTVSDGKASASTAMFAITVTDLGTGSVTLSWTPPTQNDDGSALTDLAGYEVRYGKDQANLDRSVQVTNPSVNTYVVDSLTAGTWFFAVRSINTAGNGSTLSNVASKTIS